MSGDAERGAVYWSPAIYMSEWLPRYLEECAERRTGVVTAGQPKDRVLRSCAAELDRLVRERTGRRGDRRTSQEGFSESLSQARRRRR